MVLENKRINEKIKAIENKYANPFSKVDLEKLQNSNINTRRTTVRNLPNANKCFKEEILKNLSVYFGHENWNLVLNMMIGIRATVKKIYNLKIEEQDFDKEFSTVWKENLIKIRLKGFDFRKAYKFADYSTLVFKKIREIFDISTDNYLKSIGPEYLLVFFFL